MGLGQSKCDHELLHVLPYLPYHRNWLRVIPSSTNIHRSSSSCCIRKVLPIKMKPKSTTIRSIRQFSQTSKWIQMVVPGGLGPKLKSVNPLTDSLIYKLQLSLIKSFESTDSTSARMRPVCAYALCFSAQATASRLPLVTSTPGESCKSEREPHFNAGQESLTKPDDNACRNAQGK